MSIKRLFIKSKKFKGLGFFAVVAALSLTLTACGGDAPKAPKKATPAPAASAIKDGLQLPEGHPTAAPEGMAAGKKVGPADHTTLKSDKSIVLSDEVKAKWKSAKILILDSESGQSVVKTIDVGSGIQLNEQYTLKLDAFIPDWAIDEAGIISRSNEPNNPAIQVRVVDGANAVSSGWVFESLPDFNSYKNDRYKLELLPSD